MRPIKFRGKRIDTGEWVEGWFIKSENGELSRILVSRKLNDSFMEYGHHDVEPATVGQFINRRENRGVDVFDGDLLLASNVSKVNVLTGKTRRSDDWVKIEVRISRVGVIEKREIAGSRDKEYPTMWGRFLPVEMKYYEHCGTIHDTPSEKGE